MATKQLHPLLKVRTSSNVCFHDHFRVSVLTLNAPFINTSGRTPDRSGSDRTCDWTLRSRPVQVTSQPEPCTPETCRRHFDQNSGGFLFVCDDVNNLHQSQAFHQQARKSDQSQTRRRALRQTREPKSWSMTSCDVTVCRSKVKYKQRAQLTTDRSVTWSDWLIGSAAPQPLTGQSEQSAESPPPPPHLNNIIWGLDQISGVRGQSRRQTVLWTSAHRLIINQSWRGPAANQITLYLKR